ncbi:MAG: PepSY-like domain-containing protein [Saprospiraceae bacterium]
MKNLLFFGLLATLSFLSSCNKDTLQLTDDLLAQQIAFADSKTAVSPSDLPASVISYVDENYFETYIESAYFVTDKGYEVILGTEDVLYCNRDGRILRPRRGPFTHGPCGHGEAIGLDAVPAFIVEYVAEHYPEAEIVRAKFVQTDSGGRYFIKIQNPQSDQAPLILIFSEDGVFIEATVMFFHCHALGVPMDIENLPEVITNYIAEHFPNAEIKVAFHKSNGMFIIGVITPDGRRIMAFSADGAFLWVRP